MLADILNAAGPMPVKTASDGDAIENGCAYVAPAGRHLLIESGMSGSGSDPREHVPTAVDPLFRSAAVSYGPESLPWSCREYWMTARRVWRR